MQQDTNYKKTIVFAPLNWGLGHASRIVPLINKYKTEGWKIILASDGNALQFLKNEFPNERILKIPSKPLKYSKSTLLLAHLQKLLPTFLRNIKTDSIFIKNLSQKESIDLIISDNRYGFKHPTIKSILITHQTQLAFPPIMKWSKKPVQNKLNHWINSFDECWIMDDNKHNLAGELSHTSNIKIPYKYIGLQSRLEPKKHNLNIDFLVILSGLEPHRSILEKKIIQLFKDSKKHVVIIGGQFQNKSTPSDIEYLSFANTNELNRLINQSNCIISRSGFSTIMDLIKLNKKAILIPTPGQTEQEYLAKFHASNSNFHIAENTISSISEKIRNC